MTNLPKTFLFNLFGRRAAYRLGRGLYERARGEAANDMASNGEMLVQRCVVDAWQRCDAKAGRLVVFDVGANIGNWSAALLRRLAASEVSGQTDLYIFEPVPSTLDILKTRLAPQQAFVHYEQAALSSENGQGVIYADSLSSGTNSLHADAKWTDAQPIPIVKFRAADFCRTHCIRHIHLLKCDTEGHDMEVIRGALPLLKEGSVGVLQFEYNHRWVYSRHFLRDAFAVVKQLSYRVAKLQSDHLLIFPEWHHELEKFFEGNYALVRSDALSWFPTKKASFDRYNALQVRNP